MKDKKFPETDIDLNAFDRIAYAIGLSLYSSKVARNQHWRMGLLHASATRVLQSVIETLEDNSDQLEGIVSEGDAAILIPTITRILKGE